jgi:hypothetical protein
MRTIRGESGMAIVHDRFINGAIAPWENSIVLAGFPRRKYNRDALDATRTAERIVTTEGFTREKMCWMCGASPRTGLVHAP